MVIENVRGAQPWVGRSRWSFGSYHLWGDVPALMPMTLRRGVKVGGLDWNKRIPGQAFNTHEERAIKNEGESWFNIAHNTVSGCGQNPDGRKTHGLINIRDGHTHARHLTNQAEHIKCGGDWFDGSEPSQMRHHSSRSRSRKQGSAMIAKIPEPLSRWIARTYYPKP